MRHLLTYFVGCLLLTAPLSLCAQSGDSDTTYWQRGASLGLDFSQLFQLNPRQGAGQNRIGAGSAFAYFAKYNKGNVAWDNQFSWQFGIQRLGAGPLSNGEEIPFQKAIDELRFSSKLGFRAKEESKIFYAADFGFLSQLTPTYAGTAEFPGNFLSDISGNNATPLAQLFSPAIMTISAGIDFKPNAKWSIYYSPVGGKFIVVANDDIAATGVHGNPVDRDGDGNIIGFDNVFAQFGSLLKIAHTNKYLDDKITFASNLALYSNYLQNPQNIDVDWTNELGYTIVKGLQLAVTLNLFYDDDVLVQITDYDSPNGVSGLGKRVSLTQQLLLKYNITF